MAASLSPSPTLDAAEPTAQGAMEDENGTAEEQQQQQQQQQEDVASSNDKTEEEEQPPNNGQVDAGNPQASSIPPRPTRNSRGSLSFEELGRWELNRILKSGSQPTASPRTTMFGVSPPVREGQHGGAANPLIRDAKWRRCARKVTHSNLQALRERDMQQDRPGFEASECLGDAKLLFGSMDGSSPLGPEAFLEELLEQQQLQLQQQPQPTATGHMIAAPMEEHGTRGGPFPCTTEYYD